MLGLLRGGVLGHAARLARVPRPPALRAMLPMAGFAAGSAFIVPKLKLTM